MVCKNCNSELAEGANVCPNCGTPVEKTEAPVYDASQNFSNTSEPAYYSPDNVPAPGKTQGIVALILGIISIVLSCCIPYISAPLSIAGIVVGIIGLKKAKLVGEKNTLALIGTIISVVGLLIGIVLLAITIIALIGGMSSTPSYYDYYY